MKLSTLLREVKLICPPSLDQDLEIQNVTSRSHEVTNHSIFVALQGLHTDGQLYLSEAAKRGAALIITDRQPQIPLPCPVICVEDPRFTLAILCDALCGHPTKQMQVIGVTGTNGKTSTVHFLQQILRQSGKHVAVCSTVGDQIDGKTIAISGMTTPDPEELYPRLQKFASEGVEILILEVSSHALALQKVAPIRFSFGLLTNLTTDHLDFHKTMEQYALAKARLFSQSDTVILPLETDYLDLFLQACPKQCYTYAAKNDSADFTIKNPRIKENGICYEFLGNGTLFRINLPLFGNFTYDNSLLASACAILIGIDPNCIRDALSTMPQIPGRLEEILLPQAPFRVFCDYAHTPDALLRALQSLRPLVHQGTLTVLFGCGGDRDASKRSMMGKVAAELADTWIVTEDNSRSEITEHIFANIIEKTPKEKPPLLIRKRKDAIDYAIYHARPGDVLLLAGKGHERYEIQNDGMHPFDERVFVQEAYQKRIAIT